MVHLYEQYRPAAFSEVLGQERIVKRLDVMRNRAGFGGACFWVSGKSGQGKTSIARLIAAELADDFCVVEIDADALTPNTLRDIERDFHYSAMGKGGRALIVNEAHGLKRHVIRQLLVTLESLPDHVVVIFTTTIEGENSLFDDYDDASALLSRCVRLSLATQGLAPVFAKLALKVTVENGLGEPTYNQCLRLVNDHKGNMRAVLQAIESGAMLA